MTASEKASKMIEKVMHEAHLRYQRSQLKQPQPLMPLSKHGVRLDAAEVRGIRRKQGISEAKAQEFKPEWFTHLRPNFYKAYFETLIYMLK